MESMQIAHQYVLDHLSAWELADVAARHGMRVVSITVEPGRGWHVFIEMPVGMEQSVWQKWIQEHRHQSQNH